MGDTRGIDSGDGAAREVWRDRAGSDSNTVEQGGLQVPALGSACA